MSKSAYEPSGPSGQNFFLEYENTVYDINKYNNNNNNNNKYR